MTRRFQFSLRALAVMVALAALPLGAYRYLLAHGSAITVEPAVAGRPFKIHATFCLSPSVSINQIQFCLFEPPAAGDCYEPTDEPYAPVEPAHRSWLIFVGAETKAAIDRSGTYEVLASGVGMPATMRKTFTVTDDD